MKTLLLSFALIVSLTFTATAQHWSCFYPNDTAYYLDAQSNLHGLTAVDSTAIGGTVVYKVFRTLAYGTTCTGDYQDLNTNKPTWAGPEVHKLAYGSYHFFNQEWGTLTILSLAQLNDTWRFYTKNQSDYIDATVVDIDTATVFGSIDSVKTIILNATTINDVNLSQWNSTVLKLSKLHGLIRMPKILSFPAQYAVHTRTDLKPLKYGEVYNYNVGNYFQIKQDYTYFGGSSITFTYQLVLDKVVSLGGTEVTYTFHREKQTMHSHNGFVPFVTIDTITTTYSNLDDYVGSALPNYAQETNDTLVPLLESKMTIYTGSDTTLQGKRTTQLFHHYAYEQISDTCWEWQGLVIDAPEPPFYFECLGKFYQNSSGLEGITNETLVYYNLCGQKGGAKVEVGVAELPDTHVKIYPNPATDVVEINNTSNTTYTINMVNLQGQLLQTLTSGPSSTTQVDLSQLPQGMYLLQLKDGAQRFYKKVVVAR